MREKGRVGVGGRGSWASTISQSGGSGSGVPSSISPTIFLLLFCFSKLNVADFSEGTVANGVHKFAVRWEIPKPNNDAIPVLGRFNYEGPSQLFSWSFLLFYTMKLSAAL